MRRPKRIRCRPKHFTAPRQAPNAKPNVKARKLRVCFRGKCVASACGCGAIARCRSTRPWSCCQAGSSFGIGGNAKTRLLSSSHDNGGNSGSLSTPVASSHLQWAAVAPRFAASAGGCDTAAPPSAALVSCIAASRRAATWIPRAPMQFLSCVRVGPASARNQQPSRSCHNISHASADTVARAPAGICSAGCALAAGAIPTPHEGPSSARSRRSRASSASAAQWSGRSGRCS